MFKGCREVKIIGGDRIKIIMVKKKPNFTYDDYHNYLHFVWGDKLKSKKSTTIKIQIQTHVKHRK